MPEPATQVRPDDEPVALHFTEGLREHLFRGLRKHPAQLAESHGPSLDTGENSDFPLPLNQRDCELNRPVFFGWALGTNRRSSFTFLSLCKFTPNGYGFAHRARHDFVAFSA